MQEGEQVNSPIVLRKKYFVIWRVILKVSVGYVFIVLLLLGGASSGDTSMIPAMHSLELEACPASAAW